MDRTAEMCDGRVCLINKGCPALLDVPDVHPIQRGTTALNMQWYHILFFFRSSFPIQGTVFENKHLPFI